MSAQRWRPWQDVNLQERLGSRVYAEIQRRFDGAERADPALVGPIYEAELAREEGRRRASGSFYTPVGLVRFVVEQTLAPLLEGRSLEEILALRVADPSCGGGAFLLGALERLEEACVDAGAVAGVRLRRQIAERCLVGVDLDARALEACRLALQMAVGGKATLRLQLVHGDALRPSTELPELNAIVGNPPWGQKGLSLSSEDKALYKELYRTARGAWDPCKLFVERCHQLLGEGGRWGLVLPDIVLLKKMEELRLLILNESELDLIAHCGQAFEGVNLDAVAMVATRREAPRDERELRIWESLDAEAAEPAPPTRQQAQGLFREFPGHKFNLYLHGDALALYRRLADLPRLGERIEMHEGVHSGNCRNKLFVDRPPAGAEQGCSPLIVGGKEMGPYRLAWKGRYLDRRPAVIDRAAGDYANLGRPEWHEREKLVVRRTGDRVMAAWDREGYFVSNNLFVLFPRFEEESSLLPALAAYLNSSFVTWYFRALQPRKGRLFAELKLEHLRDFPLPRAEGFDALRPRLADLARQKPSQEQQMAVDELIERAFEISPAERRVIRLGQ